MKRRSIDRDQAADADEASRALAELRAELDEHRRRDESRRRFDALSDALLGALDPDEVADRAERWVVAALGRPCSIHADAPADGHVVPLGTDPPKAWLRLDGPAETPEDEAALAIAVDKVTRALDAAHHVAAQRTALRTLEHSLLPDALLAVPGLQVASRYVPAKGSHDVGGDFYDAVVVDGVVTLIVGDVQGKGIGAATLTSLARHTLRAGALAGQAPAELLGHLNRALLYGQREQLAAGVDSMLRFVTAVVGRLDPAGADGFRMTVARAGQPPPLIVRSDGRFDAVEPRGVLLGVCDDPEFEERTGFLAVGDALVLYTDGVIEQRGGEGKAMTEQHLGMLVRNRRGVVDAEAIASLIEETVHLVAPEDVRDDVAILVACPTRDVSGH